jgi:hypothetical protein
MLHVATDANTVTLNTGDKSSGNDIRSTEQIARLLLLDYVKRIFSFTISKLPFSLDPTAGLALG